VQFNDYKEDFSGSSIKLRSSPLVDDYFSSQYKRAISDAKRFGLIKKEFAFESWAETRFLKEALRTQELEGYWTAYDADGKPKA
jgi:sulfonate transport system substrate-binding protein